MQYSLLICSQKNHALQAIFQESFNVSVVNPTESLLEQIRKIQPNLLVLDADVLLAETDNRYAEIAKDQVYHDIPVLAYCHDHDETIKYKLYEFSVKGICTSQSSKEHFIECAYNVLSRSNPHVGSFRDKFIKAFINYEDARQIIIDALYLANYLIQLFRIDAYKASNIRLTIILLTVGLKKRKIRKIVQLLNNLEISNEVLDYLKNYHKFATKEEKIIVAAMTLIEQSQSHPLLQKAYTSFDADMIQVIDNAIKYHKIYIASSHDIYVFLMRFNKILGEQRLNIDNIESHIEHLRDILLHTLVRYGNFYAQIKEDDSVYCISATLENETSSFDNETINMLHCYSDSDKIEFQVSNYTLLTCIKFEEQSPHLSSKTDENIGDTIFSTEDPSLHTITSLSPDKPTECKRQVDTGFINCMHYEDHQKISAKAFLEEFEYDHALIDDLNESENDAKDALYFDEELSSTILEAVITTFIHYTHILNETIEFRDLAYSINSLIALLQSIDIAAMEPEKQKLLKIYLTGIFENLESWKAHIFITQDSPDIHYLDASLLNDCAQVESLFITAENNDESELEFF